MCSDEQTLFSFILNNIALALNYSYPNEKYITPPISTSKTHSIEFFTEFSEAFWTSFERNQLIYTKSLFLL